MTAEAAIDLADPAVYRFWIDEHVRFADLDPLGHANNAAVSGYLESARVALFARVGNALGHQGRSVVLARLLVEFRAELRYADRLRVGVRLGRSSLTLGAAVFRDETCAASSEAVCVAIDVATRRPVEIAPEIRAALNDYA